MLLGLHRGGRRGKREGAWPAEGGGHTPSTSILAGETAMLGGRHGDISFSIVRQRIRFRRGAARCSVGEGKIHFGRFFWRLGRGENSFDGRAPLRKFVRSAGKGGWSPEPENKRRHRRCSGRHSGSSVGNPSSTSMVWTSLTVV